MAAGYVMLSGPPGSGKSTLGPGLADELGWPYLAKDTIKQALLAEVGAPVVVASRRLGMAAMKVLIAIATEAGSGVLDGTWLRDRTPQMVRQLPGPVVEVFCRCRQELLEERYRLRSVQRGAGHFDGQRSWAELWGEQTAEPVDGGWPVIEADTTQPVDAARLAQQVRIAINGSVV